MPYQMMYSSQASAPMTVGDLEQILTDARSGNEARNVTGALVYVDGVFFQILEGDKDVLNALMANISRDTRHHSVKIFYQAEVDRPAFGSWRMACLCPSAKQMSAWAGLPGTTTVEKLLDDLYGDPQRAPTMLVNLLKALTQ